MTIEAPSFQAPEGLFSALISLENGRLGNAYTKRFIRVLQMPDIWPELKKNPLLTEDMAVVEIRIRKSGDIQEEHFLGIRPDNSAIPLESWTYRYTQDRKSLATPPVGVLLGHIIIAQKLQPSLKRR